MRLLLLTQYFPPEVGAAQTRLAAITRELHRAGHQVEVLTALPSYPEGVVHPLYRGRFYLLERRDGVAVHRVWTFAAMGIGARRAFGYLSFAATALVAAGRVGRPDVVLVESPPLTLMPTGVVLAKVWRARVLMNVADLWPDAVKELGALSNRPLYALAERLERWSYERAAIVTTVTYSLRERLITEKGVPSGKVVMLPNGVDTMLFTPREPDVRLARKLGLPESTPIILYAGTHGEAHGLAVALDAAQRLGDAAHFVFIGSGSAKGRLVADARHRRLSNVRFLDPMQPEDLAFVYGHAFAALSTLRQSALLEAARPAKIFTAMAAGVPIVYSGEGEGADVVRRVGAGIVTPPADGAALAAAIAQLIETPGRARAMGERGRAYVVAEYDWSFLVRRWLTEVVARLAAD